MANIVLAEIPIQNVPDYAMDYPYWVVRLSDSELWFYGAYETEEKAHRAMNTLYGMALTVKVRPKTT